MLTRGFQGPPDPSGGAVFGGLTDTYPRPSLSMHGQPASMQVGSTQWGMKGVRGGRTTSEGYMGLDPSDPSTHTRLWMPTTGMFERLHQEMGV